ncbi:ABC transporter ATP-binding protein [Thiohalorhabdus sp. Cl-TMA]|uniref:ABC transporter ATP-binding protein n=1 Tax=Thiohalorhabdus methylotrophus TaxID=3242694 RepID=A0ABV4TY51_9GAMM
MQHSSDPILWAKGLGSRVSGPAGWLTILDGIELAVAPGEAVAVLGPSGAGKSTLLGLLAGLDAPTSGDVRMFGSWLGALDEDGRAALRAGRVGFVFQSFQLVPGLTALENVMLPLELAGRARVRETALGALERVGLGERVGHLPGQLSGGEQQRAALARAFAPDPDLLFADEPTGNLDGRTGSEVIEQLFALRAERGSTLVLVTHDEAVAGRCDRRLRMVDGTLEPGS